MEKSVVSSLERSRLARTFLPIKMATLPPAASDAELLQAYAADPARLRASRAAVAAAAARALVTRGSSLQAARTALLALTGDPPHDQPSALEPLLDLASAGTSVDDAIAFTSATAAWKALTLSIITSPTPAVCDLAMRKRLLLTAAMSASTVLEEITETLLSSAAHVDDSAALPTSIARHVTVLRFHVTNLARYARRFMEQSTLLTASDACVPATLRLLSMVLYTTVLKIDSISANFSSDIDRQVLTPAAAAARAVLIMCRDPAQVASALDASYGVAVGGLSQEQLSGRLVAVAYFARMAETEGVSANVASLKNVNASADVRSEFACTGSGTPRDDLEISVITPQSAAHGPSVASPGALHNLLLNSSLPVVLPLIFQLTSYLYVTAFNVRTRVGGHSLASIAISAAVSCASRSRDEQRVVVFMLEHISSRNTLVSHVAAETIVSIASRIKEVFDTVMRVARIALAADLKCAESRWVALAARIGVWQCQADREYANMSLFSSTSNNGVQLDTMDEDSLSQVLCDNAGLRVLAEMCRIVSCMDAGYALQSEGGDEKKMSVDVVLNCLGLPIERLAAFCKRTLLGSSHVGRVSVPCMLLLPYLGDTRAVTGAAVACLKRGTTSDHLAIATLRSISPQNMPESSLRIVATELPRLVARHGGFVRIAGLALATKAPTSTHASLQQAVTCTTVNAKEVDAILAAAVTYYERSLGRDRGHALEARGMKAREGLLCIEEGKMMMQDTAGGALGLGDREAAQAISSIAAGLSVLTQAVVQATASSNSGGGGRPSDVAGGSARSSLSPVIGGELAALFALVPALAAVTGSAAGGAG